ncbi:uncharacterized protein LOC143270238 [Peromyscus maniculatus bairdii]|uniref:uncharacterized protein LOC143270238 n=1 Tax=Peromyscus maniculatus bairdii TaxID=230844 RepID=UPI003FD62E56
MSLQYAWAHNHPDMVTLLLSKKASIDIQDDEGYTPLIKKREEQIVSGSRFSTVKTIPCVMDLSSLDETSKKALDPQELLFQMVVSQDVGVEKKAPCDPHMTVWHNLVHLPPTWDGEGVDPVDNKKVATEADNSLKEYNK